jgi:imidazole glycerol-phosphate synthase subunit HisH
VSSVAIIDSGGANLASLEYAFERLGTEAKVTHRADEIRRATHVILPGVGSARAAMQRLREAGLVEPVRALTQPVLGICLGMQLLYEHSEEGDSACLGLLPGRVRRLRARPDLPVPHMGWNQLAIAAGDALLEGCTSGEYAYFVHSYAAPIDERTLASTAYGQAFAAVVRERNFCGTQFHPERSGRGGARILANFLKLTPCS